MLAWMDGMDRWMDVLDATGAAARRFFAKQASCLGCFQIAAPGLSLLPTLPLPLVFSKAWLAVCPFPALHCLLCAFPCCARLFSAMHTLGVEHCWHCCVSDEPLNHASMAAGAGSALWLGC
jgi:hypothetical protein